MDMLFVEIKECEVVFFPLVLGRDLSSGKPHQFNKLPFISGTVVCPLNLRQM